MKKALVAALILAALIVPASALAKVNGGQSPIGALVRSQTTFLAATTTTTSLQLSAKEQLVIDLINRERAKYGLQPVRAQLALMKAARAHSAEMVQKRYFSHNSYNGDTFAQRDVRYGYARTGFSSWAAGENIAWGQGLLGTPQAIVDAWMHSTVHRQVILTAKYRDCGVGIASGSYKSGAFFFTLDFGSRTK